MLVSYESLSGSAKVWIYPASRKFYKHEVSAVEEKIIGFTSQWKNNDQELKVSYQFFVF